MVTGLMTMRPRLVPDGVVLFGLKERRGLFVIVLGPRGSASRRETGSSRASKTRHPPASRAARMLGQGLDQLRHVVLNGALPIK